MAPPKLGNPRNVNRTSSLVNRIVETVGGGEGDEAALLNGLAILGYDPVLLQSFSDQDPNRRFVNDAIVRAFRAGVSQADIEKALKVGAYLSGRDIERNFEAIQSLSPEQRDAARRAETQRPFAFKGEAPPAPPVSAPGVTPGLAGPPPVGAFTPVSRPQLPTGEPKNPAEIRALQQSLNARGAKLTVDGVMGPKTRAAWQAYGGPSPAAPAALAAQPTGAAAGAGPATGVGAGAAPTGGVANQPPAALRPGASDAEAEAFVRQHYGYFAWTLQVPEIRNVIFAAARGEGGGGRWDTSRLYGALQATDWWRNTAAATRLWTQLQSEDPAEAARRVNAAMTDITALTGRFGFKIADQRLRQIATDARRFDWTPQELNAAVAAEFDYAPDTEAPALANQMKTEARKFLVPLSEQTIDTWGRDIIAGRATEETWGNYLRETAKSLFPQLTAALDAGQTVEQYVEPYRQIAARELEITPDSVDFLDPKWNRAIQAVDPKSGSRTSMTLSDFQRMIRTDPTYNYDKTTGAREQAAEFVTLLAETFGRI